MNRGAADCKARKATTPPRKFEGFFVKSDGSQLTVDERPEWPIGQIPLLVVTLVYRSEGPQKFLAYKRTASDGAAAYAGGRDEVLAVFRDIGLRDGIKLLDESFGKEKVKCDK